MKSRKAVRRIAAALVLYVVVSGALAILIAEATLHPARRVLSDDDIARGRDLARRTQAALSDPMIIVADGTNLHEQHSKDNGKNKDCAAFGLQELHFTALNVRLHRV